MTKIWIVSDLHADMPRNAWEWEKCNKVLQAKIDLIIVAGDIANDRELAYAWIVECYKRFGVTIVFVAGNHDYYNCIFHEVIPWWKARPLALSGHLIVLENEMFSFRDLDILGCSLWTDLNKGTRGAVDAAHQLSDYRFIRILDKDTNEIRKLRPLDTSLVSQQSYKWLMSQAELREKSRKVALDENALKLSFSSSSSQSSTVPLHEIPISDNLISKVTEINDNKVRSKSLTNGDELKVEIEVGEKPKEELKEELKKELKEDVGSRKLMMVTHHLPTYQSIDTKYQHYGYTNASFASHYDPVIKKLRLHTLVHGHSHSSKNYEYKWKDRAECNENKSEDLYESTMPAVLMSTTVICNPRGYAGENPEFDYNFVITI